MNKYVAQSIIGKMSPATWQFFIHFDLKCAVWFLFGNDVNILKQLYTHHHHSYNSNK